MNTVQLPSKFESEIVEDDVLYRSCFRFLALLRADPAKLRQAAHVLAEIAQDLGVEEDEDDGDD